nr:MAG TPA: hypothetical protein [Podoviridae sp. ctJ6o53]
MSHLLRCAGLKRKESAQCSLVTILWCELWGL